MYGVPLNLQRVNSVFFNKAVLERYGIAPPRTLDDLLAAGRKLHDQGIPLLAVGSREPWTLELLFFESLLVSREGPDVYRDYFRGRLRPDDPRMLANLRAALELSRYFNPDHDRLSWLQAMDRVIAGQAAMTAMGDWARVSLSSRGLVIGRDFGEMAFPGTENVFVFTSDAFPLPRDAKNPAGARRLLATIGSAAGQLAADGARQTLAARLDAPPPASDATLTAKYQLVKDGRLVLALSGMLPRLVDDDLGAALAEMLAQGDPEPAVETLRSRYALLK
jgi:glucose/mannose transport system substrate-binding protein